MNAAGAHETDLFQAVLLLLYTDCNVGQRLAHGHWQVCTCQDADPRCQSLNSQTQDGYVTIPTWCK